MKLYQIHHDVNVKEVLDEIGVDGGGKAILASKMKYHLIRIEKLHVAAANILKQDALSIGADLAVPKGVILCEHKYVNAVLMATTKQLQTLSKKELAQDFGLKYLAHALKRLIQNFNDDEPLVMGIINANADSFYHQSRFLGNEAIQAIEMMIEEGAKIIDLGGVSSRPGSEQVDKEEELKRVKPIVDLIYENRLYDKVRFSIDSFTPEVVEYALQRGFAIVNDITGLADDSVCEIAARYKAEVVIMHMQGSPQTMQKNPQYDNVISDVEAFFQERIEKARGYGIEKIILDVGIGFGKSLEDNLKLIRHLRHFRSLGYPLLLGASRKSLIDAILPTPLEERLPATLAIHMEGLNNGASIIRCHDVKAHIQAISVQKALKTVNF